MNLENLPDSKEIVKSGRFYCPNDPHFVQRLCIGTFEGNNLVAAMKYCRPGVAIDGGAHVGSWTVKMAEFFSQVIAFEPEPVNFECLKLNASLPKLHNVILHNKALGNHVGKSGFHNGTNSGSGFLVEGDSVEVVTVDSLCLDELSFLKLDVEGYEPQALEGSISTITKFHPVVLVEQKPVTARYGKNWQEAGRLLQNMGYVLKEQVNNDFIYT